MDTLIKNYVDDTIIKFCDAYKKEQEIQLNNIKNELLKQIRHDIVDKMCATIILDDIHDYTEKFNNNECCFKINMNNCYYPGCIWDISPSLFDAIKKIIIRFVTKI